MLRITIAVYSVASWVSPAVAQQGGTSIGVEQTVRTALQRSAVIRAAEARVRLTGASIRGADALPGLEFQVQHGFGAGASGLDEDLTLTQLFPLGSKRSARLGEARAEQRRAQAELAIAQLEVAFRTRVAYLAVREAEAVATDARAAFALAERFRQAAADQFAQGEAPRTHVLRADIELAIRRDALAEATAELMVQRLALASLTGESSAGAEALVLSTPPPIPTLAEWRKEAAHRPEIAGGLAELEARSAGLRAANADGRPDFFLAGTHADLTRGPGNVVRAGFILTLWDHGVLRARRAQARSAIEEQQHLLDELRRVGMLDLEVAYMRYQTTSARLQRFRAEQLDQARTLADLAQVGYEAGETSYLELLDAQRLLREAQLGAVHALADTLRAELAVRRAAGSSSLLPRP